MRRGKAAWFSRTVTSWVATGPSRPADSAEHRPRICFCGRRREANCSLRSLREFGGLSYDEIARVTERSRDCTAKAMIEFRLFEADVLAGPGTLHVARDLGTIDTIQLDRTLSQLKKKTDPDPASLLGLEGLHHVRFIASPRVVVLEGPQEVILKLILKLIPKELLKK